MNSGMKERASVYEWYLPDLELDTFAEKKKMRMYVYIQKKTSEGFFAMG